MLEPPARGSGTPAGPGDPTDATVGRVLDGRYRIGARIARGGMASVYEATDLRLDRTVAIKIMHAGLGDASAGDDAFAARFVREAKAAARLSHPNVVAVYDQGTDHTSGTPTVYLAMELVPGHTLRDTIAKEAPMSPERALALLDPVISALASAHRSGLIHRDVKPENVLIADDGRIKVADFGLAKAVSADTQHTATQGVLIGTVSYLAPELVVDGIADPRADVYAVGVILYELLTGTKPHTGESPIQVAYRHVHNDVPPPSQRVPGLPAYVDALVQRATARDRTLRPADAGVLLHHVHRVQSALHQGLREDPELVEDLVPATRAESTTEITGEVATGGTAGTVGTGTSPEPVEDLWDETEAEALFGPPRSAGVAAPAATAAGPDTRERTEVIAPAGGDHTPSGPTDTTGGPGPAPAPHRQRRRGPLLLVLLLVLVAAVAGGGYWFAFGRYTTTPDVAGLSRTAAQTKLHEAGLDVRFADPAYSSTVEKGQVIGTDPDGGARILPHHTVTVTLSRGPELHDVPDVRGLSVDDATSRLASVKLVVSRQIDRYSETVPEGDVIRTDPAYGTKAAKRLPVQTGVRLIVSKGRRPIHVGHWVGKDADKATAAWHKRGLKVDPTEEFSDTVKEGVIIHQDPDGGTLYKDDTVSITVSKGPEMVEIPSVFYETTDQAKADLHALGLKVDVEHAPVYFTGSRAYSTDPPPGTEVRKGSTVVLYVV